MQAASERRTQPWPRRDPHLRGGGDRPLNCDFRRHLCAGRIGLFKTEVIHRRGPWRSVDAVEHATLERIDGFNNRRLLESTGNVRLAELEMQHLRQRSESAIPP
jgi:hypothetical protein